MVAAVRDNKNDDMAGKDVGFILHFPGLIQVQCTRSQIWIYFASNAISDRPNQSRPKREL